MREPKLIYFCPIEELVGRRVVNEIGDEGTITEVYDPEVYTYNINVVFNNSLKTYMMDGYEHKSSEDGFITFLAKEQQPQQETEEYKKCIKLIRDTHKCSLLKALEIYNDLNA